MAEIKKLPGATHLITPECRLSFPVLFEPKPYFDKGDEFQCTLLFPPETDFRPFFAAMKAAMIEKWDKVIKIPASENPIKDASEKEYAGYDEGWHFLAMHGTNRPAIVDQTRTPITDPERCYPGLWVRAHINAFAWTYKSKKGVSFGLNAIQIVRDADRLDGRVATGEVFEPLAMSDDEQVIYDSENYDSEDDSNMFD